MSASTEKKNRQAAREAGTDKKLLAAQEAAKKKKVSKIKWTVGSILVAILIALILFLNSGYFHSHTDAVTIGGQKYTPAEINYRYTTQYYNWYNTYGSYASMFGIDTSKGIAGLSTQIYNEETGSTWKDSFMEQTFAALAEEQALISYAEENGIALDEKEIAEVDAQFEGIDDYAKSQGFASADKFFAANYGEGVDTELIRDAAMKTALASKAYSQKYNSLSYTADELETKYKSFNGESDVFDYVYYLVSAETVATTAEDGTESSAPTEETLAAAKTDAEALLIAFESETGEDAETRLNAALAAQGIDGTATHMDNASGSSLGEYKEWLMAERASGDATVVDGSAGSYVIVFLGRDDNHYPLARVRHILVKAAAGEDGTYTDEAKAEALAKAEDIYDQWLKGDKTEESFAALANEHSEDEGSNTNGGLYENFAKGQSVEEFDAFIYGERQAGDSAIVYGESSSYAGYHIMYYVGEGQLYSDYLAKSNLLSTDMEEWIGALTEGIESVMGFGYRFTI